LSFCVSYTLASAGPSCWLHFRTDVCVLRTLVDISQITASFQFFRNAGPFSCRTCFQPFLSDIVVIFLVVQSGRRSLGPVRRKVSRIFVYTREYYCNFTCLGTSSCSNRHFSRPIAQGYLWRRPDGLCTTVEMFWRTLSTG